MVVRRVVCVAIVLVKDAVVVFDRNSMFVHHIMGLLMTMGIYRLHCLG